ncbi:MAG: 23S rRNA (adenine(2503)-C(2))-methyltransferase RlmN [Bacteroidales bacterium]
MMQELRNTSEAEIKTWLSKQQFPAFRYKQIESWLWQHPVDDIVQMQNLPVLLRDKLKTDFYLDAIEAIKINSSNDGSMKVAFSLSDDTYIEGVLIPSGKRITACISTQVGCRLGCRFCATGGMGFTRNLHAGEIYLQAWKLNELSKAEYGRHLSNIVVMGMGEPLDNYDHTVSALRKIIDENGMGMSPRRITLSTAGLAPNIKNLAGSGLNIQVSVSLHAADNELRSRLMPINNKYDIHVLAESLQYYYQKTKKRLSYEYILFHEINDSLSHVAQLAEFVKITPCKINLIEYNMVEGSDFKKSNNQNTHQFIRYLEDKNIVVNLRNSRGDDVDAGCGQLANKF